jgi:uncharacterized damage-inducible protein DinB
MEIGPAFIRRSREYLVGEYLPKIRRSLDGLTEEDIWWRPNPASNSIGNLILHLAGNSRQWIVSGIGGAPDSRRREEEFAAEGGHTGAKLLAHLDKVMKEVDEVLLALDPEQLSQPRVIQGMHVTVLEALYHVVEHFSTHTGQIIYLSKMRTGKDLRFWKVENGKAVPNW